MHVPRSALCRDSSVASVQKGLKRRNWRLRQSLNEYPGVHKLVNVEPCAGNVMVLDFTADGVKKPIVTFLQELEIR